MNQPLPTDGQAMRNYVENYSYDAVGNFLQIAHQVAISNWTRTYAYDEPNASPSNNRLTSTTVGALKESYTYDTHGNMTQMLHLPQMAWDFQDQLASTQRQVVNNAPAETTYYVYNSSGQRMRKVTQSGAGAKIKERIYLGGYEVYREYASSGSTVTLERQTLHVMDDKRRVAMAETNTTSGATLILRFQFDNHLASVSLELDASAAIISYEEYYPYGSTSYQAVSSTIQVSPKPYRYTGKERDEETGFSYHGARYYAPWIGRWVSCDPIGVADGPNCYIYGRCNPIRFVDVHGTQVCPANPQHIELHLSDQARAEMMRGLSLAKPLVSDQDRAEMMRGLSPGETVGASLGVPTGNPDVSPLSSQQAAAIRNRVPPPKDGPTPVLPVPPISALPGGNRPIGPVVPGPSDPTEPAQAPPKKDDSVKPGIDLQPGPSGSGTGSDSSSVQDTIMPRNLDLIHINKNDPNAVRQHKVEVAALHEPGVQASTQNSPAGPGSTSETQSTVGGTGDLVNFSTPNSEVALTGTVTYDLSGRKVVGSGSLGIKRDVTEIDPSTKLRFSLGVGVDTGGNFSVVGGLIVEFDDPFRNRKK